VSTVGDEFTISLKAIDSSAEDTDADFPLEGNLMEIGNVQATEIVIDVD
jgi:hypothetical protein